MTLPATPPAQPSTEPGTAVVPSPGRAVSTSATGLAATGFMVAGALAVGALGFVLSFFGIGVLVLLGNAVWVIYRLVVGLLKAADRTPVVEGAWGLAA